MPPEAQVDLLCSVMAMGETVEVSSRAVGSSTGAGALAALELLEWTEEIAQAEFPFR